MLKSQMWILYYFECFVIDFRNQTLLVVVFQLLDQTVVKFL